jgi:hypothetical protein
MVPGGELRPRKPLAQQRRRTLGVLLRLPCVLRGGGIRTAQRIEREFDSLRQRKRLVWPLWRLRQGAPTLGRRHRVRKLQGLFAALLAVAMA